MNPLLFAFMGLVAVLTLSQPARAIITPEKYCQSMSANSCEVLNIAQPVAVPTATGTKLILVAKMCLNQNLRMHFIDPAANDLTPEWRCAMNAVSGKYQ